MWLRRLAPDFKTIADFRRDNSAAIVGACRAFVLFCRDQGLFTARLVALEGSKFRAAASAKPRCTTAERRLLTRHFHEDALQRMNARVEADPDLMRQRRCAAEHPFGTIKRMTTGGRFLTRGITKVKAEAALSILAYNILRAINLIGPFDLRARLA